MRLRSIAQLMNQSAVDAGALRKEIRAFDSRYGVRFEEGISLPILGAGRGGGRDRRGRGGGGGGRRHQNATLFCALDVLLYAGIVTPLKWLCFQRCV